MAPFPTERTSDLKQQKKHPIKAWGQLISILMLVWIFGTVVGPWLETRIPTFNKIVETIEKHDIDSGAYFYSEIKGSYDGERYLRDALELGAPDDIGLTLPFVSGIVLCLVILWIGFRFLPLE